MLALMALMLVFAILVKMKKARYAWVVGVPALFMFVTLGVAGVQKLLPKNGDILRDKTSHITMAQNIYEKLPSIADSAQRSLLEHSMVSNIINAILCAFFMLATAYVCIQAIRVALSHLANKKDYPLCED